MANIEPRWMTVKDVCAVFRFSRTTLWMKVRAGALPPPHHLGARALWRAEDIGAAERRLITPPTPRAA